MTEWVKEKTRVQWGRYGRGTNTEGVAKMQFVVGDDIGTGTYRSKFPFLYIVDIQLTGRTKEGQLIMNKQECNTVILSI